MKKKIIIILLVLILLPLCVFGGIKLHRVINDEYAAIEYAVDGSGYSVISVDTYEDHLVYAIQGKGDYLGIKRRYEEYLLAHPDSFLNDNCPIEIVFRNGILRRGVFILTNFVPQKIHNTELVTTKNFGAIHNCFDVAYIENYRYADVSNLFEGNTLENDIEVLIVLACDTDISSKDVAEFFPNIKKLYASSSVDKDTLKEILPDCEWFDIARMFSVQ